MWRQMQQFKKSLYLKMNLHGSIFIRMLYYSAQMSEKVENKQSSKNLYQDVFLFSESLIVPLHNLN